MFKSQVSMPKSSNEPEVTCKPSDQPTILSRFQYFENVPDQTTGDARRTKEVAHSPPETIFSPRSKATTSLSLAARIFPVQLPSTGHRALRGASPRPKAVRTVKYFSPRGAEPRPMSSILTLATIPTPPPAPPRPDRLSYVFKGGDAAPTAAAGCGAYELAEYEAFLCSFNLDGDAGHHTQEASSPAVDGAAEPAGRHAGRPVDVAEAPAPPSHAPFMMTSPIPSRRIRACHGRRLGRRTVRP